MKIGFTGTRKGMTGDQAVRFMKLLDHLVQEEARAKRGELHEFHFGVCVGADQQAAEIAAWGGFKIVGHPGAVPWKWAGSMPTLGSPARKVVLPIELPLNRDHTIVDVTDVLVVTPKQQATPEFRNDPSVRRGSGTWATVRYAADKVFKPVWFVWPNGTAERFLAI